MLLSKGQFINGAEMYFQFLNRIFNQTFHKKKDNCLVNFYEKSPLTLNKNVEYSKTKKINFDVESRITINKQEYLEELKMKELLSRQKLQKIRSSTTLNNKVLK
jgi:hypothetical protein